MEPRPLSRLGGPAGSVALAFGSAWPASRAALPNLLPAAGLNLWVGQGGRTRRTGQAQSNRAPAEGFEWLRWAASRLARARSRPAVATSGPRPGRPLGRGSPRPLDGTRAESHPPEARRAPPEGPSSGRGSGALQPLEVERLMSLSNCSRILSPSGRPGPPLAWPKGAGGSRLGTSSSPRGRRAGAPGREPFGGGGP
jgi:hypothetical protein